MDCGPATLKCLLEGFGIPASYGRLREACQTSVDGTSIDVIESVARQLGLDAEQVMLPMDYLWIPEAGTIPALVVVRRPNGANHFVVIWKRLGPWIQIMDPAVGRRWINCENLYKEVLLNKANVSADAWLDWAGSDETLAVFRNRLRKLGIDRSSAGDLLQRIGNRHDWRSMAALDAALRMLQGLVAAGGLRRGKETLGFMESLLARTALETAGTCNAIPPAFWSVAPSEDYGESQELMYGGAVLLRVKGRLPVAAESVLDERLTPELAAAKTDLPLRPLSELWSLLKADGLLSPLALMGAVGLAMGALIIEALLFRGFIDLATDLNMVKQRMAALVGLLSFLMLLGAFELPVINEALRLGRHLECRLRLSLVKKLPRISDRYFHSRPVSDMAERSHSVYLLRYLPEQAMRLVQSGWELIFTLAGIGLIAPQSVLPGSGIAGIAIVLSLLAQPWISELDLKLRSHNGALQTYYLDSLLGVVPVRTHSAERSVRREHEALLTEWARSAREPLRLALWVDAARSLGCFGLAGWILFMHIQTVGVTGNLLLLVYWVLKLPALGERLGSLVLQYPAQRNIVLRLLEPLRAPEEREASLANVHDRATLENTPHHSKTLNPETRGLAIEFEGASVVAGGHTILQNIRLSIQPGEHIAIVGPSGAGKSSLLGVLLGWYSLIEGRVSVDGLPLTRDRLTELRRQTAWIDPAIQIWNRPLLDNLRYNPMPGFPADLGQILEKAQLTKLLAHWPEGLQTSLGEGGARVSGGEGQRVRLGRAMWQQGVRLALLDEPFRGLGRDQRNRQLNQAREIWSQATLLCVTHDVSETQSFDRVLVVENGGLVEDGSPAVLLANCNSRYRALLQREEALRKGVWCASFWRRIHLAGGRLVESDSNVNDHD